MIDSIVSPVKINENFKHHIFGGIDILKFALSIIIVAIHTEFFSPYFFPLCRIAVPCFFIISSYLFFCRIDSAVTKSEEKGLLIKFIKRNLLLYLFWFLILIPITIYAKRQVYFSNLYGILYFLRDLVFGSTFYASRFIIANVICIIIVYFLRKHMALLTFLSISLFLISLLTSSYSFVIPGDVVILINRFINFQNCFISGLIYSFFGFLLIKIKINKTFSILFLFLSIILLYLEFYLLKQFNTNFDVSSEIYILNIPSSIFLFCFFKNCFIKTTNTFFLRKISTVIYCSHMSICVVLRTFIEEFSIWNMFSLVLFAMTLCLSVLVFYIIYFLSRKFKFFNFFY